MNCQKCKTEIEDRDLRRESLSDAAQAHKAACANCRVFGEERLALRRLVGGLEKVSAPADFDFRMRARLAAERSVAAPRAAWFNFSPAALSWPLAGCLALVVSASLYFQPQRPDAPVDAPAAQTAEARETMPSPPPQQTSAVAPAQQDEQAAGDETPADVDAIALKRSAGQRRHALPSRLAARASVERELAQVEESTSTSLMGATPRFASSGETRRESALIPVPLDAPEGQLKVLLRDTSGGARTISVDSVSFGSRDVMGRPGATFTRTSLSSNQGVW
jgi:hypothetical protein